MTKTHFLHWSSAASFVAGILLSIGDAGKALTGYVTGQGSTILDLGRTVGRQSVATISTGYAVPHIGDDYGFRLMLGLLFIALGLLLHALLVAGEHEHGIHHAVHGQRKTGKKKAA